MGAIAGVTARDLRLAAAGAEGPLRDAALRSASRADQVVRLAAGGAAREEKTSLGLLLPRVSELLGERLTSAHSVVWNVPAELPPVVGSASEWTHVLTALAERGITAMAGGGTVTVEAGADAATKQACLVVADSGAAIPPERLARLLEPSQVPNADGNVEGSGLGLISSMIEVLGGTIAVTSTPGRGTTVTVTVPLHGAAVPAAQASRRLEGVVLVADDYREVRQVLRRVLEGFGLEVVESVSGTAALTLFREAPDRFRALMLDVVMEGTPAEEVVVRARELRPNVPIVLMSGYDVSALLEAVLSLGGVRFLAKPLTPEAVFTTLHDLFTIRGA
jgi:CheY-like chemotaxis protein